MVIFTPELLLLFHVQITLKYNFFERGNYFFSKLFIISGWVILIFLAYKVSQFDYEYANFDPYEILGVPLVSNELSVV
jgi:preprotein translocase subunit Sec63